MDLLNSVAAAGALNTTFFLLMGDHGFRMGETKFQSTEQGIIENNMPGLVVIPPTTFVRKHEDMMVNLKANTKVLTSHYDLHHTLRHILAISLGKEVDEVWGKEVGPPGASLFSPLEERTCGEAGVPLDFCSCPQGFYPLPSKVVEELMAAVLMDMDAFLAPMWGCLPLHQSLASITKASMRVEEGKALVQSLVRLSREPVEFMVRVHFSLTNLTLANASLTRIDKYSATSKCVPLAEASARPYCVCPPEMYQR